jgi:hypothetical protein
MAMQPDYFLVLPWHLQGRHPAPREGNTSPAVVDSSSRSPRSKSSEERKLKSAVVTGVTGTDGAYLTHCCSEKGYKVYGTFRRTELGQLLAPTGAGRSDHENLHARLSST